MSDLPHGWTHATIEQLAGSQGLVTDGDWIETKDQDQDGNVRLIQLADIGDGEFRDRSARFVTTQTAHRLNCTFLEKGDLLIARMPDPLGRACIFPKIGQRAITAVDVFVWRASPGGPLARWLMHFVNSRDVRDRMAEQAGGTTRQRISGGRIKQLEICVPPLSEQQRIVAKIDSLTGKSNRACIQLNHIPRLVEKYKQAILAATFNDASFADWEQGRFETFLSDAIVGLVRSKAQQAATGNTPYIRMNHFDMEGTWNDEDLSFVKASRDELRRYELKEGDVLFNTRNSFELVGKVAVWPEKRPGYVFNNNLLRLRFAPKVDPYFACLLMMSPTFRAYLQTVKSATTSVCAIYQRSLMEAPFAIPSLDEQRVIVQRVGRAIAWIVRLASEAASARKLIDHLDEAVLGKAFRGELVPQDPDDEPASVLLERIRAERQPAEQNGRKARQRSSKSLRRASGWR